MARKRKNMVRNQGSDEELIKTSFGLDSSSDEDKAKAIAELRRRGVDIKEAEQRLRAGNFLEEEIDDQPLKSFLKKQWPLFISLLSFAYLIYLIKDLKFEQISEISTKLIVITAIGIVGVLLYIILNIKNRKSK